MSQICSQPIENFPSEEEYHRLCGDEPNLLQPRGVAVNLQSDLQSNLAKYGCWCDLENKQRTRGGPNVVNEMDGICKQLHINYNCIERSVPGCDPRENNNYAVPFMFFFGFGTVEDGCNQANPGKGECEIQTCIADAVFLKETLFSMNGGYSNQRFDTNYKHIGYGGTFDYDVECPSVCSGGGCSVDKELQCCGELPAMVEFNADKNMCCANQVVGLGSC